MRNAMIVFSVLFFLIMQSIGCGQASAPASFARFSITTVSAGPWESYREQLQPNFKVDANALLSSILATTSRGENKVVQGVSGGVEAAVPGGEFDLPQLGYEKGLTPPTATPFPSAKDLPGLNSLGSLELDLMTKHQLTSSVFQEIQMLNAHLRDVAIPEGFRAFVVRLNVGVLVQRNDLSADFYATIGFFHDTAEIRVIPMIATDSIEAALRSNSAERIRDLAAGLSAGIGGVGMAGDIRSRMDRLSALLARDLNSTFQVFHEGENSVIVKIGAMNSYTSKRALVGRTFPMTVLLLAPDELWRDESHPVIRIAARMALHDASTGDRLPSTSIIHAANTLAQSAASIGPISEEVKSLLRELASGERRSEDTLLIKLLFEIKDNNFEDFRRLLACHSRQYPLMNQFPREVWLTLLEGVGETGFSSSTVTLASNRPPRFETVGAPCLIDDGKATSVTISGFVGLGAPNSIRAALALSETPRVNGAATPLSAQFPGRVVGVSDAGAALSLQFESLKRLGLRVNEPVKLRLWWWNDGQETPEWDELVQLDASYAVVPAPAAPSPYKLVQYVKSISVVTGEPLGAVKIAFVRDKGVPVSPTSVIGVRIVGAEIDSFDMSGANPFVLAANDLTVSGAGGDDAAKRLGDRREVTLKLRNYEHEKEISAQLIVDGKPVDGAITFTVKK